jgi:DNA-binding CsgD family transcriptional regulator
MRTLQTNEWMILNNIIYEIHTMEDFDEMRIRLLEQLKMLIDYDSADFYMSQDDEKKQLCEPVMYNCTADMSAIYENLDHTRQILYSGKSLIYRETDIISDDALKQTDYYQKVFLPNNWHYSLQMIVAREGKLQGVLTFYRNIGKQDFAHDDIFILDLLTEHLAYRLWRQRKGDVRSMDKLSVTQAAEKYELTRQEHNILRRLMEGKDNAAICDDLSISINTLKKHILNIYRKLGIKNRVQLFKMIRERE